MKKVTFSLLVLFAFIFSVNAQILPNKIKNYLDANYISVEDGAWKQIPGACDGNKSVLIGDFDGDGQSDYLVRFTTGKNPDSTRLYLVAFLNRFGEYTPLPVYEAFYADDLKHSASAIIKKGTTVSFGLSSEGEGPKMILPIDAVAQYICETDASKTFIFKNGEMVDIQDGFASQTPTVPLTTSTPVPVIETQPGPTPFSTPHSETIPNLSGNWTRKPADGSVSDLRISVVQTGVDFTLKVNENQVRGSIAGDKFIVNGLGEKGTIEQNGNLIRWSDGVWVREVSPSNMLPNQPTLTPSTNVGSVQNLNGKWILKMKGGNPSDEKTWQFIQNGEKLNFVVNGVTTFNGKNLTGRIKGDSIIIDFQGSGTIEQGGNVLQFRNGEYFVREGYTGAIGTSSGIPTIEQNCINLIQTNIAWNRAGNTNWDKSKLSMLCMATDNPLATMSCFKSELQKQDNLEMNIQTCSEMAKIRNQTLVKNDEPKQTNPIPIAATDKKIIDEILIAHNKYRAEVGVAPLKWSETLAGSAQLWANEMVKIKVLRHSQSSYGENLWAGIGRNFSYTQMVDAWGAEKQFFVAGVFPNVSTTGNWSSIGHYTQMIWTKTTEVGCAEASGGQFRYFVCQYNPMGNIGGQRVF